ncbi:formate dehydrogenase [Rhodoferax ferrireducens]|uniref:formate dehydrogenase n=1 Tax=Rhodoferax ferrireducens TaxID=192843 RepID=UPI000E0DD365|nr:formate dehydrogenase [Rhodoferax ferrireducens]
MSNSQPQASRRGFFLSATVAGAAVASATLLKTEAPLVVTEVSKPLPEKGGGYSLSDHVKQYYKTTRV